MSRLFLATLALTVAPAAGQAQTPIWNGSVQCEIDIQGPGYKNHQTHTWTLTGALAPDGNPLDYPGTWSVSGSGSIAPTATQPASAWTTQGSAGGVRMAIFVRQSDQKLLVFLRQSQLSVANGTTSTQADLTTRRTQLRSASINPVATEWRPFPTIEDVPTSSHIVGSSTATFTTRLDALQPLGSEGRAACSWNLVRGDAGAAAGVLAAGGAAATIGKSVPGGTATASTSAGSSGGTSTTPPPTPTPAGCDADLESLACPVGTLFNGSSMTMSANFHLASDTVDWLTITATMSAAQAPFAVLDFSLSGGTSDGTYEINVSEGSPGYLNLLGSSGTSHAPQTTIAWSTASTSQKKLYVRVRHVAGVPANDLYALRMSMSGSQTVPLTVVPVNTALLGTLLPSGQTGTIAPAPPSSAPQPSALSPSSTPANVVLTPTLPLTVVPNQTAQNLPTVTLTLTGQNTHFVQGTTTATLQLPTSSTTLPITVTSATVATAQLTLPAGTPTGRFTVTVATGLEVAQAASAFMVTPAPDSFSSVCALPSALGSLAKGVSTSVTGVIEQATAQDWFTVSFLAGTSLHLTLDRAPGSAGGSDFQMQAFGNCSLLLSGTSGSGAKALDLPDSGPHTVLIRVLASAWDVAGPSYMLRLEGR